MKTLKDIAADMGVAYLFADWTRANIALDGARLRVNGLPVMLDVLPASGSMNSSLGMIATTTERMVWFLDAIRMDSKSEDDGAVVERMLALSREFIARVNACRDYRHIDTAQWRAELAMLDENVGGVCLMFNLTPVAGVCENDQL